MATSIIGMGTLVVLEFATSAFVVRLRLRDMVPQMALGSPPPPQLSSAQLRTRALAFVPARWRSEEFV